MIITYFYFSVDNKKGKK